GPGWPGSCRNPRCWPAWARSSPPAKKRATARTLKAKFPGRCACGRSYAAGESIAKNAQGWGHPECRTAGDA
ncbi:ribonuclease HI, partial [Streptomyces sp. NPDC001226]